MSSELSLADLVAQFAAEMQREGIECEEPLHTDGKLHRFRVTGDKTDSRNGWYVLHADGIPAGEFGCWKRDIKRTWRADIGRKLSASEEREHRKRLEAMQAERKAAEAQRRAEASTKASQLWNRARKQVAADHPYLQRKGARAFGLRQMQDALLVPLRDGHGHVHGLQFIQANGDKRFLNGSAVAGHYHAIKGSAAGEADGLIAIVEGYATGATVREVTGWPVAVAFDAGNLAPVARALRKSKPTARLVVCADNDHQTPGNPGAKKAHAAASEVGGPVALPEFGPDEEGTDWNDWAEIHGLAKAGRALRAAACATPPSSTDNADAEREAAAGENHSTGERQSAPASLAGAPYPHFEKHPDGVYWHDVRHQDGKVRELPPQFICSPLHIRAVTRDTHGRAWGRLVEFEDLDAVVKQWALPARLLGGGRGDELRGELLEAGLPEIATEPGAQRKLIEYLMRETPPERARCVTRTGWHADAYVTPTGTFGGNGSEHYYYQTDAIQESVFEQAGDLAGWREEVAEPSGEHHRLIFAISCAFAGPLMHLAGVESGGFHLVGGSSSGKTTALRMAATVWGSPDNYWRQWRATDNGLEAIAEEHNDCLLALDEIGQADPRSVGEVAYMLANGRGKARANTGGGARRIKQWRVMLLSTGEVGTAAMLNEAGKTARAGHEVRLVELPADAGKKLGIFDTKGGHENAALLAEALLDGGRRHYGLAGPQFVARLAENQAGVAAFAKQRMHEFAEYVLPKGADGQVRRVAQRFGCVCRAGELAAEWGLTGWRHIEVEEAIAAAFNDWLQRRGGAGAQEPRAMVQAVRAFIELHGGARFQDLDIDGPEDDTERRIISRAGFRTQRYRASANVAEQKHNVYLILPEVFRQEVCAGYDPREVARALRERGLLLTQESTPDRHTIRYRLPISKNPSAVYAVDAGRLFSIED